jgi:hypothetical protein
LFAADFKSFKNSQGRIDGCDAPDVIIQSSRVRQSISGVTDTIVQSFGARISAVIH